MFNYPVLFFPLSLFVLWLSALVGILLRSRRPLIGEEREDFGFVQAAARQVNFEIVLHRPVEPAPAFQ
jgi:hypothetical protein